MAEKEDWSKAAASGGKFNLTNIDEFVIAIPIAQKSFPAPQQCNLDSCLPVKQDGPHRPRKHISYQLSTPIYSQREYAPCNASHNPKPCNFPQRCFLIPAFYSTVLRPCGLAKSVVR